MIKKILKKFSKENINFIDPPLNFFAIRILKI